MRVLQYRQTLLKAAGGESSADFARFLQIAIGSASETEYLILLSHDLKYLTADQYAELMDTTVRVKKMLTALVKNVRMNSRPAPTTDNR